MNKNKENLGTRIKMYESFECSKRTLPLVPVIARLDGKNFHNFCKNLQRPYDKRFSDLMIEVTKYLVTESNASMGYTQSDEITLTWYSSDIKSSIYFDGRIFKMVSILSSYASVYFNKLLFRYLPEKVNLMPIFDCRVFNVPTLEEGVNVFLWRERDATKNSISMLANKYYSHNSLIGINSKQKLDLLMNDDINWNEYPTFFKRGTYIQKRTTIRKYTVNELMKLPEKHEAKTNPDLEVERSEIIQIDMPNFNKVTNKVDVIYFGADPITIDTV